MRVPHGLPRLPVAGDGPWGPETRGEGLGGPREGGVSANDENFISGFQVFGSVRFYLGGGRSEKQVVLLPY